MRIGVSSNSGSHRAGMSSLWHDAEYLPQKKLDIPTVERGLEGMPLPSEKHQLPEGVEDPFHVQEQAYDVAAQQMERGIKGIEYLYGKKVPTEGMDASQHMSAVTDGTGVPGGDLHHDPVGEAHDVTRTLTHGQHHEVDPFAPTRIGQKKDNQATDAQLQKRVEAGNATPKVSKATSESTAGQKGERAKRVAEMGQGIGVTMAGVAVSQAIDPTALGGTAAVDAVAVVKAAATSKLAVGMAGSISDVPEHVHKRATRQEREAERVEKAKQPDPDGE